MFNATVQFCAKQVKVYQTFQPIKGILQMNGFICVGGKHEVKLKTDLQQCSPTHIDREWM